MTYLELDNMTRLKDFALHMGPGDRRHMKLKTLSCDVGMKVMCLGLYDQNKPVGLMEAYSVRSTSNGPLDQVEILIYVRPEYRNQGYGYSLFGYGEQQMVQAGFKYEIIYVPHENKRLLDSMRKDGFANPFCKYGYRAMTKELKEMI